jgi:hypothetical protein
MPTGMMIILLVFRPFSDQFHFLGRAKKSFQVLPFQATMPVTKATPIPHKNIKVFKSLFFM